MNKTLIFTFFAIIAFCANAQLALETYRHAVIGPYKTNESGSLVQTDKDATLTLLSANNYNRGAFITFGEGNHVAIGEYISTYSPTPYRIRLHGDNGIRYNNSNDIVFDYLYTNSSSAFNFYCPVKVQGLAVSSDARLKSEVKSLSGVWT